MAAKKYYAVKKGKITGVFNNWADCKRAVDGFPGAEYKGFATQPEAQAYLNGKSSDFPAASLSPSTDDCPSPGTLLAYVDGSYDDALRKYAFGCVFLLPDGRIYTEYGNGCNEESLKLRNVTGEMLGAMFAAMFAIKNKFEKLEIRYDYQGIEKWVTGEWKARTELTGKYAGAMRGWMQGGLSVSFTKVTAHSNVAYNELADRLAKAGLRKGNGVPKVRFAEEMEQYDGTASSE